jgi:hypothetical protein
MSTGQPKGALPKSSLRRGTGIAAVLVAACVAGFALAQEPAAPGQAPQEQAAPYDETEAAENEEAARKMITDIRTLVLPQQKERAEEMIQKYPNTKLAKLAEQLLAEYKLYDTLRASEYAKVEARTAEVREYWKSIYPSGTISEPAPMSITNLTDEPVLYQIQGPETAWSGPHNLRIGDTHYLKYPVTLRRVTNAGVVKFSLRVGQRYVFRRPAEGEAPQLYRARD